MKIFFGTCAWNKENISFIQPSSPRKWYKPCLYSTIIIDETLNRHWQRIYSHTCEFETLRATYLPQNHSLRNKNFSF